MTDVLYCVKCMTSGEDIATALCYAVTYFNVGLPLFVTQFGNDVF